MCVAFDVHFVGAWGCGGLLEHEGGPVVSAPFRLAGRRTQRCSIRDAAGVVRAWAYVLRARKTGRFHGIRTCCFHRGQPGCDALWKR